jgi:hypothetical protein
MKYPLENLRARKTMDNDVMFAEPFGIVWLGNRIPV